MCFRLILAFLFIAALPLEAQAVFELKFLGEKAKDIAGGHEIQLHHVVIMGSGDAAYGDLDGKGAIEVSPAPELSFGPQETFWAEMWVHPVQLARGVLLSKGGGSNYRLGSPANGEFAFSYYSQGGWRSIVSQEPLRKGDWQHVACYFDSSAGMLALFLDGKVVAHTTGNSPFQSRDDLPLYIGGGPVKDTGEFAGMGGMIGTVVIARGNPRSIPSELEAGQQVFEVTSPY